MIAVRLLFFWDSKQVYRYIFLEGQIVINHIVTITLNKYPSRYESDLLVKIHTLTKSQVYTFYLDKNIANIIENQKESYGFR